MLLPQARGRRYYGWVVVLTLSLTELTSWGVLYYGFAVIMPAMEAERSRVTLTGGFSLALLLSGITAVPVGRWLDRHGPRLLMTVGSIAATLLLVAWSQVQSITGFYLVWAGMGFAFATVLYEPTFAAVATWFSRDRSKALVVLTFFAGLASLAFIPLTARLVAVWGWRTALLQLAIVVGVLTILPHALLLRRRPADLGLLPDGMLVVRRGVRYERQGTGPCGRVGVRSPNRHGGVRRRGQREHAAQVTHVRPCTEAGILRVVRHVDRGLRCRLPHRVFAVSAGRRHGAATRSPRRHVLPVLEHRDDQADGALDIRRKVGHRQLTLDVVRAQIGPGREQPLSHSGEHAQGVEDRAGCWIGRHRIRIRLLMRMRHARMLLLLMT